MYVFPLHSIDTAPEKSVASLQVLQQAFGFLPNIAKAMSTSPVLIECLVALFGKVHTGSFSEPQIQVLLLTNAVTNRADWPVALHSFLALKEGISAADVDAVRAGNLPADPKLAALSAFAKALIEQRGRVDDQDKVRFLAAGFTPEHLLEVVSVSAASTITNYTASITAPPLEPDLASYAPARA